MPSRRWLTAWRLIKSGRLKDFFSRLINFFSTFFKKKTEVDYSAWREKWVELNAEEKELITRKFESASKIPAFTLLIKVDNENQLSMLATIDSVVSQLYPNWEAHIINSDHLDPILIQRITSLEDPRIKILEYSSAEISEWVIELTSETILNPAALSTYANSILKNPEVSILYADHDHITASGIHCDPYMKPDWNHDLLAAMNYFAPFIALKKEIWESKKSASSGEHEFLVKKTEEIGTERIKHLPFVLSGVQIDKTGSHLEPTCKRIIADLRDPNPKVSILIPTRDQGRLLKRCLKSLSTLTEYPDYELIIINHESSESRAIRVIEEYSERKNCRVFDFSGVFNFSAIMNYAASLAIGDVLVLLNNDTEVVDPDWLTELVSQVSRPEVGVAGPLLLFGDGTIQHAGIHPGLGGLMGHGHKHLADGSSGYFNRLKAVHEVAAVTGACLAIEKSTWDELGGLDEKNLPIAYNDVDLCIRSRQKGLRVIFTPYSKVVHHESVSRGVDAAPEKNQRLSDEIRTMHERWGPILDFDPAYSPNLLLDGGGFKLSKNPRGLPFWKDKSKNNFY